MYVMQANYCTTIYSNFLRRADVVEPNVLAFFHKKYEADKKTSLKHNRWVNICCNSRVLERTVSDSSELLRIEVCTTICKMVLKVKASESPVNRLLQRSRAVYVKQNDKLTLLSSINWRGGTAMAISSPTLIIVD